MFSKYLTVAMCVAIMLLTISSTTEAGRRGAGPSGDAKVHNIQHGSQKAAKDAARQGGQGAPIKHQAHNPGQRDHFHSTDGKGGKKDNGVHHNFGPKRG
ncbi:hypothetical protein BV898_06994 [Hypsibius exemplaris]|uniref:Uncharacterized protein n=1 Tax=Hypsibius exemplaris TaxID=2072580 RepID=A0A1W0WUW1_HYPEX|nr:hypothetical protein BV898_06994 [Hypsibius exemplaris]